MKWSARSGTCAVLRLGDLVLPQVFFQDKKSCYRFGSQLGDGVGGEVGGGHGVHARVLGQRRVHTEMIDHVVQRDPL